MQLTLTEKFMFDYLYPGSIVAGGIWGYVSGDYSFGSAFVGAIIGGSIGWLGKEMYLEGGKHFSHKEYDEMPSCLQIGAEHYLNGVNIKRRNIYDFLNPGIETAF